jgi:hypothetical protein
MRFPFPWVNVRPVLDIRLPTAVALISIYRFEVSLLGRIAGPALPAEQHIIRAMMRTASTIVNDFAFIMPP